jgi:hypothetical protein
MRIDGILAKMTGAAETSESTVKAAGARVARVSSEQGRTCPSLTPQIIP